MHWAVNNQAYLAEEIVARFKRNNIFEFQSLLKCNSSTAQQLNSSTVAG
jgi:hypothetical protein